MIIVNAINVVINAVMDIVESVRVRHGVDSRRVVVTGVSMGKSLASRFTQPAISPKWLPIAHAGGLGTWMVAAAKADHFAAAVPMCGGGKPLCVAVLQSYPFAASAA